MRAIDADACEPYFWEHLDDNGMAGALNAIAEMPTIEPRKKGKWIEHNPHKWGLGIVLECSECGEKIECEPSNYCPNCGAEMTEESEEPKRCDTCKHEKSQWFTRCADCSDYELWEKKE